MGTTITRRHMLEIAVGTGAAATLNPLSVLARTVAASFTSHRPALQDRKFHSPGVETYLSNVCRRIGDPELAWLFENCHPQHTGYHR